MTAYELYHFICRIPDHARDYPVVMHGNCERPHVDHHTHEVILPVVPVSRAWGIPDNDEVIAL